MAYSFAGNNAIATGGPVTTLSVDLPSTPNQGDTVCVALFWFSGGGSPFAGTVTVQDTNGNVYTQATNSPNTARPTTSGVIYLFHLDSAPANVHKHITATWSNVSNIVDLVAAAFVVAGGTSSYDQDAAGNSAATNVNITSPTIPAVGSGELFFDVALSDHQVSSVASPWTQIYAGITNPFSEGVGYILSSASLAVAFVQNIGSGNIASGMSFKISGAAAPFIPVMFPNPAVPRFPTDQRTHASWFVIDDNAPFRQTEWTNPIGPKFPAECRGFIGPAGVRLIGKDQFFGAPGERTPVDQPNPQIARRIDLTHVLNLLGTTLGIVADAPFRQTDWSNPRGYVFPADLRTFINAAEVQLLGKDQFFGAPGERTFVDFPNPRGYTYPTELRTFVHSTDNQLADKDQFFGAPGERTPPDQPNPMLGKRIDLTHVVNLLETTLGIVFPMPFNLQDQPNPRGYIYPNELRTFLNAMESQLIGKDQMFGAPGQVPQYEFPNPQIARRLYDNQAQMVANLLETTLGIVFPNPFVQTEWPNPLIAGRSIALRTFVEPTKLNLLGQDQFFGAPGQPPANYDQPNPRGYTYPVVCRVFVGPLNNALLASVGPVPFAQTEWPNPQVARQPIVLKTFLDPTKIHLIGKDKFFGASGQAPANLDWPNPRGYKYSVSLRSWMDSLLQSTLLPPITFRIAYIDGDAYVTTDISMDSVSFTAIDGDSSLESQ